MSLEIIIIDDAAAGYPPSLDITTLPGKPSGRTGSVFSPSLLLMFLQMFLSSSSGLHCSSSGTSWILLSASSSVWIQIQDLLRGSQVSSDWRIRTCNTKKQQQKKITSVNCIVEFKKRNPSLTLSKDKASLQRFIHSFKINIIDN